MSKGLSRQCWVDVRLDPPAAPEEPGTEAADLRLPALDPGRSARGLKIEPGRMRGGLAVGNRGEGRRGRLAPRILVPSLVQLEPDL